MKNITNLFKNNFKNWYRQIGIVASLLLICMVFSMLTPLFLEGRNLITICLEAVVNSIIAIGMTLVIITAGIDLSVGSTLALTGVVTATLMNSGMPVSIALIVGLLLGVLCGIVNGLLISFLGLQPFLVTLGTMSLFRGIALIFTNGKPIINLPNEFRTIVSGFIGGFFPIPIIIAAVFAIIGYIVLKYTKIGEYIFAIGGNEEATRFSGVNVIKYKIITYAISGLAAALAAIILIARLGAAEPIAGSGYEMNAIAAAAIGGASLSGGKGSIIGTILGALILSALVNGLTLLNVQAFYQLVATGAIIIVAVLIDEIGKKKK